MSWTSSSRHRPRLHTGVLRPRVWTPGLDSRLPTRDLYLYSRLATRDLYSRLMTHTPLRRRRLALAPPLRCRHRALRAAAARAEASPPLSDRRLAFAPLLRRRHLAFAPRCCGAAFSLSRDCRVAAASPSRCATAVSPPRHRAAECTAHGSRHSARDLPPSALAPALTFVPRPRPRPRPHDLVPAPFLALAPHPLYSLLTAHYLPPIAHCSPPTSHYSLSATH